MASVRTKLQEQVKITHVVMEIVIMALAALIFFPLSKNTQHFNKNCLLNSDIYVTRHSNESVSLDLTKTVFGDMRECYYTTFVNVVVALHSIIWIWFFLHIDTLRRHNGSAINLLFPALLTHFILLICCIISSIKISAGFDSWCENIESNNQVRGKSMSCKDYESSHWTENRSNFYTYSVMALGSSWTLVVFIIISMVVTVVHLYWDFMATAYVSEDKTSSPATPLETSGFVDDGVGVINKGAAATNYDDFLKDSDDEKDEDVLRFLV